MKCKLNFLTQQVSFHAERRVFFRGKAFRCRAGESPVFTAHPFSTQKYRKEGQLDSMKKKKIRDMKDQFFEADRMPETEQT